MEFYTIVPWAALITGISGLIVGLAGIQASRQRNEAGAIADLTNSVMDLNQALKVERAARQRDRQQFNKRLADMENEHAQELQRQNDRIAELERINHELLNENHRLRLLVNNKGDQ